MKHGDSAEANLQSADTYACCMTLQSHKQSLQRKLQERKTELESKQEQLASTLQESDAMRAVIAGQTVNKDDVVRMNQEK